MKDALGDALLLLFVVAFGIFLHYMSDPFARTFPKHGFPSRGGVDLDAAQIHALDSLRRIDRTIAGY